MHFRIVGEVQFTQSVLRWHMTLPDRLVEPVLRFHIVWNQNRAGVNPKFCVNSIWGANRAKFIQGGSRGIGLLPC